MNVILMNAQILIAASSYTFILISRQSYDAHFTKKETEGQKL